MSAVYCAVTNNAPEDGGHDGPLVELEGGVHNEVVHVLLLFKSFNNLVTQGNLFPLSPMRGVDFQLRITFLSTTQSHIEAYLTGPATRWSFSSTQKRP
jgi:hypothetical protein